MPRIALAPDNLPRRYSLSGGHVLDLTQGINEVATLYIDDGRVAAIDAPPEGFDSVQDFDVAGLLVTPGLIDIAPHLRDPGPRYKGQLTSEVQAGLAGGYTTLCPRPDTSPVLDNPSHIQTLLSKAEALDTVRVLPLGALTQGLSGQLLTNMAGLKQAGCVALTNLRQPIADTRVMLRCLEYAATFDIPVHIQPEDAALAAGGCAHEGVISARLGLSGISDTAEIMALSQWLMLIEQTGVRAHFSLLSAGRSVDLIAQAKARGLDVTADVGIAHLHWTDRLLEGFDSRFHFQPPLRDKSDRTLLREGLSEGIIDAIVSDHLPHEAAAKLAPFAASQPGMASLETCFSMGMALVEEGVLGLPRLVEALTRGPAMVLGEPLGHLSPGSPADLALFDLERSWTPTESDWHSAGFNTPLAGVSLKGQCVATLTRGVARYVA